MAQEPELLTERVITPMSKSMVEAINNWRFEHRCESKADAVRQLIELGLAAKPRKAEK
jgi:hypothetical protein